MKILLVGDASGAYQSLHYGFQEIGVQSKLLLLSPPHGKSLITKNTEVYFPQRWIRPIAVLFKGLTLEKYDVISFTHRISMPFRPIFFRYFDLPIMQHKAKILSYTALGCDEIAALTYNEDPEYTACSGCEKGDNAYFHCLKYARKLHAKGCEKLVKYFDCVVIALPDYSHVENYHKRYTHIPLPVRWDSTNWKPASFNKNIIKIVHSPTRKFFKGSDIVEIAMREVLKKHKNIEFSLISGLSYEDYLKSIGDADIVIDQTWSHSAGMNGLLMLAMGKVVFSGNTSYGKRKAPWQSESPIIDASPEPFKLAEALCRAIGDWKNMKDLPEKGLAYIRKYHDPKSVAEKYIKTWGNLIIG